MTRPQAQKLLNSNDSVTGLMYNHTTASVHFDYICPPSNVTSTGATHNGIVFLCPRPAPKIPHRFSRLCYHMAFKFFK